MKNITLALWSNLGEREKNIQGAIQYLQEHVTDIHTSSIYKTTPLEDAQQNMYYNCVITGKTWLSPEALLDLCKQIEQRLWRKKHTHWWSRSIDIDIIFYGKDIIQNHTPDLCIPHKEYKNRNFVLIPLLEINPDAKDPLTWTSIQDIAENISNTWYISKIATSHRIDSSQQFHHSLLSMSAQITKKTPQIVWILNLTPDSFSDGQERSKETIHARILDLIEQWADIIDVWAESTAPWSKPVDANREFNRLKPFFELIWDHSYRCQFSLDTTKATIAREWIKNGITYINDVSWWKSDKDILWIVWQAIKEWYEIYYVMMYSKNTSWRADLEERTTTTPVVDLVSWFFSSQITLAEKKGIPKTRIILDTWMWSFVSIDPIDSVHLLQAIPHIKKTFWLPVFIWTSRKWFLWKISPDYGPLDRVWGTLASSIFAMQQWANFIRVHNVRAMKQFITVWDALHEKKD